MLHWTPEQFWKITVPEYLQIQRGFKKLNEKSNPATQEAERDAALREFMKKRLASDAK